jgi:tetratricopeptide (TPR) repeat protein
MPSSYQMMAQNAIDISPEYSLAYAAMSLQQAVIGEVDSTLANVKRTMSIRPRDPGATGVASAALVIIGQPLPAIDLLSEAIQLNPNNTRTPFLNLLGIAQYVMGDYTTALKSFEKNLAQSGPSGPHMDVFLAATYLKNNKSLEAQVVMEKMLRTDPDYPIERWLNNFIKSEEEVRETVDELLALVP